MRTAAPLTALCLALGVLALISCTTTQQQRTPIDDPSLHEGLERVNRPGIEAIYRKPGIDVSVYDKLLLRPVEVAFAKDWERSQSTSVTYRMKPADFERIKSEIAAAFAEVFKEELQTKGGYQIVDTSGPDVLEVRAALVNIYINAPDVSMQTAGRTRTFTTSAGQMTLIAELHDSVTGQLLSRAYDRKEDMGGTWQWTNSITNSAEAKRAMKIWADVLRTAMDAARERPPSTQLSER